jgi:Uma2 family endonuclease
MDVRTSWHELTVVPRAAISLPLELPLPPDFDVAEVGTWPAVGGRLEYVAGKLQYMPPCADEQQQTAVDAIAVLAEWRRAHPDFVVGGNEAGMLLGGDVRAADVAVWSRAELGPTRGGLPRVPPRLAVEVAGRDDDRETLLAKAKWYLEHGVATVWIIVPRTRQITVVDADGITDHDRGSRLPEPLGLPALSVDVAAFFVQLDGG